MMEQSTYGLWICQLQGFAVIVRDSSVVMLARSVRMERLRCGRHHP